MGNEVPPGSEKVLILTPVKDASQYLDTYFEMIFRLTYPHELISLGFLESDSTDATYERLLEKLPGLRKEFRSASIFKRDFGFRMPKGVPRWAFPYQRERRSVLAKSRNQLLFRALRDEEWVLWMDVDVLEYPPGIIERLLGYGKDIIEPNCVLEYGGPSFDLNAWRSKGKYHLDDLKSEGVVVKLDAVGGAMLLVKADLHRDGLIFPTFPYGKGSSLIRNRRGRYLKSTKEVLASMTKVRKAGRFLRETVGDDLLRKSGGSYFVGEIETEGFGIMAHDMGHDCWGVPGLEIKHRKEPEPVEAGPRA